MPIDHWMMFGTFAEQRHFVYPSKSTYSGVVINGNMAAHAPSGLAGFLLEKTAGVKYIVDPMTHAFQHAPQFVVDRDGDPKSSIRKLGEAYGEPLSEVLGRRPLQPGDLADMGRLHEFVLRCLNFQNNTLSAAMAENDSVKYFPPGQSLTPKALISPYFFVSETTYSDWLPIMVDAARICKENCPSSTKLFGSVVISQGVLLDQSIQAEISSSLNALELDGYLLWVDNLDEQQAAATELKSLLNLAGLLRGSDEREVLNLHGGYFSVLAAGTLGGSSHFTGVTHGPEFGEFRSVVPVGGGIPIARYYLPQLHARTRYDDALTYLNEKGWLANDVSFHGNVCGCVECRETIAGDIANFTKFGAGNPKEVRRGRGVVRIEFPTTETKLRCLRHYLQRKEFEFRFAATSTADAIVEDLRKGWMELKDVAGRDGVDHLLRWAQVLTRPNLRWP